MEGVPLALVRQGIPLTGRAPIEHKRKGRKRRKGHLSCMGTEDKGMLSLQFTFGTRDKELAQTALWVCGRSLSPIFPALTAPFDLT